MRLRRLRPSETIRMPDAYARLKRMVEQIRDDPPTTEDALFVFRKRFQRLFAQCEQDEQDAIIARVTAIGHEAMVRLDG